MSYTKALSVVCVLVCSIPAYLRRHIVCCDRLCGLEAKVPGYTPRDPGIDSRHYQIFWETEKLRSYLKEKVAAPV
jgi:hypothetical protein